MHDPMTQVGSLPWYGTWLYDKTGPIFTLWHIDPEKDGSDDSCGWYMRPRHLPTKERKLAKDLIDNEYDNLRSFFPDKDRDEQIARIELVYCTLHNHIYRRWWQHPRWHFWHWRLQIHPLQNFKRWAFSRCAHCDGRFRFGEAPTSYGWGGTGPLWFRSEKGIYHSNGCIGETLRHRADDD